MENTHNKLFVLLLTMVFSSSVVLLNAQNPKTMKENVPGEIYIFDGVYYELFPIYELKPLNVKVSSTLYSKTGRYNKTHLTDNNPSTAWVEGVKGKGIGQKIRFTFDNSALPDLFSIIPGYKKSDKTWYNNNRVSKLKLTILSSEDSFEPNEIIGEFILTIPKASDGKIKPGEYSVNISSIYLQNMLADEFGAVEAEILEVDSKGAVYDDTCISEIRFYYSDKNDSKGNISVEEYRNMFDE